MRYGPPVQGNNVRDRMSPRRKEAIGVRKDLSICELMNFRMVFGRGDLKLGLKPLTILKTPIKVPITDTILSRFGINAKN